MTMKGRFMVNIGTVSEQWSKYRIERGLTNEEFARLLLDSWKPSPIRPGCRPYMSGRREQNPTAIHFTSNESSFLSSKITYTRVPFSGTKTFVNPAAKECTDLCEISVEETFESVPEEMSESNTTISRPDKRKHDEPKLILPVDAATLKTYSQNEDISLVKSESSPKKCADCCDHHCSCCVKIQKDGNARNSLFYPEIRIHVDEQANAADRLFLNMDDDEQHKIEFTNSFSGELENKHRSEEESSTGDEEGCLSAGDVMNDRKVMVSVSLLSLLVKKAYGHYCSLCSCPLNYTIRTMGSGLRYQWFCTNSTGCHDKGDGHIQANIEHQIKAEKFN